MAEPGGDTGPALALDDDQEILTVGQLNATVRHLIERAPDLQDVWVRGELSNWRGPHHASGHAYFRLKDDEAEVDAVMWRGSVQALGFEPADGLEVLARGEPTVYEVRGRYQFVIREMIPGGEGELAIQFQLLKRKLEEEGLFAPERKRKPPAFPLHVGVVTSKGGAAFRDVLNVLRRRSPHVSVLLADAKVQGEGASASVARAIERLDRYAAAGGPLDVILVCRGGGSLEDLWAFNEEAAVRAVAASKVPIISGVGHETDWTLVDLAADVRAPTPSAAAELAAPGRDEVLASLDERERQLAHRLTQRLELMDTRLEGLAGRPVLSRPEALFAQAWQRTDELATRLPRAMTVGLERAGARLGQGAATLDALSPLKVLGRGYAVAQHEGHAVRSITEVATGDPLDVRVKDGTIRTEVRSTQEASR